MDRDLSYYVVIINGNCNIMCQRKWLPVRMPILIDYAQVSSCLESTSYIPSAFIVVSYRSSSVHVRNNGLSFVCDLSEYTNSSTYHRN